jgi:hypothetical protein
MKTMAKTKCQRTVRLNALVFTTAAYTKAFANSRELSRSGFHELATAAGIGAALPEIDVIAR